MGASQQIGLTYFGKRYLSPYLGRWVSADPLAVHGLGGDLNAYAYVHGRVLSAVDPRGLADTETEHQASVEGAQSYSGPGDPSSADATRQFASSSQPASDATQKFLTSAAKNADVPAAARDLAAAGGQQRAVTEAYDAHFSEQRARIEAASPHGLESAAPVWGAGKSSYAHVSNGDYAGGAIYFAMALWDLSGVKAIATGGVKLALRGSAGLTLGAAEGALGSGRAYSVAFETTLEEGRRGDTSRALQGREHCALGVERRDAAGAGRHRAQVQRGNDPW